jgi:hypothetical protein
MTGPEKAGLFIIGTVCSLTAAALGVIVTEVVWAWQYADRTSRADA